MPPTDPRDVLLAHDRWATASLIRACEGLSDEQLRREFEMGVGSLHATLTHMLGAMRGWTDVLNEAAEPRGRLEGGDRSIADLASLHKEVADEFERATLTGSPSDVLRPNRAGKIYAFTRGGILTHVTTHSMHHRAQCLNMLRHLGIADLPPSSVMEWMLMAEPAE